MIFVALCVVHCFAYAAPLEVSFDPVKQINGAKGCRIFLNSTVVDCGESSLTEVPQFSKDVTSRVRVLNLSTNNITLLNLTGNFPQLETVWANYAGIESLIPSQLGTSAPLLSELFLRGNYLATFPNGLPTGLVRLDLGYNQISQLPDKGTGWLTGLKELYLDGNLLGRGTDLNGLKDLGINLEFLTLSDNHLKTIENASWPPQLRVLDLKENLLQNLTMDILLLGQLQRLDVSNNQLASLDSFDINSTSDSSRLWQVGLADNPLPCDCATFQGKVSLAQLGIIFLDSPTCRDPSGVSVLLSRWAPESSCEESGTTVTETSATSKPTTSSAPVTVTEIVTTAEQTSSLSTQATSPTVKAPLTSTTAPLTSTTAPLTSTTAPLKSTTAPLASTTAPLNASLIELFCEVALIKVQFQAPKGNSGEITWTSSTHSTNMMAWELRKDDPNDTEESGSVSISTGILHFRIPSNETTYQICLYLLSPLSQLRILVQCQFFSSSVKRDAPHVITIIKYIPVLIVLAVCCGIQLILNLVLGYLICNRRKLRRASSSSVKEKQRKVDVPMQMFGRSSSVTPICSDFDTPFDEYGVYDDGESVTLSIPEEIRNKKAPRLFSRRKKQDTLQPPLSPRPSRPLPSPSSQAASGHDASNNYMEMKSPKPAGSFPYDDDSTYIEADNDAYIYATTE